MAYHSRQTVLIISVCSITRGVARLGENVDTHMPNVSACMATFVLTVPIALLFFLLFSSSVRARWYACDRRCVTAWYQYNTSSVSWSSTISSLTNGDFHYLIQESINNMGSTASLVPSPPVRLLSWYPIPTCLLASDDRSVEG